MSSILDALEKANRKRQKEKEVAPGIEERAPSTGVGESSAPPASPQHHHTFWFLVFGIAMLTLLLFAAVSALIYLAVYPRQEPVGPSSSQVAVGPVVDAQVTDQPSVTPTPTPAPTPLPEATPAASPVEVAEATPTGTPVPEATATPEPTVTPSPLPTVTPTATPATPRFAHMQVVYDEELGINIRGVIADGSSSVIMIDETTVPLGRRYGKIRPIRIENRMIEAEYDQDGEEITVFIRW